MPDPGSQFERRVSDFCKRIWDPEFVKVNHKIDGREVDILVDSPNELFIIECTIERGKRKAETDISKMREIRRAIVGDANIKPVRGYFITQHDPSADVHEVATRHGSWIEACSLPAFINKYNSSSNYITIRKTRPFGSVRNPANEDIAVSRNQYVSVPFQMVGAFPGSTVEISLEQIVHGVLEKTYTRVILTGDFGIGKSMTFRELFYQFSEKYIDGETYRFPMYINLKDGSFDANDDAVDLIERHARWVNMRPERDKLVHAWMSDCCIVFLDGFDEVARSGFNRLTTSSRHLRWSSAHIVRQIVHESKSKHSDLYLWSRELFFDVSRNA